MKTFTPSPEEEFTALNQRLLDAKVSGEKIDSREIQRLTELAEAIGKKEAQALRPRK